MTKRKEKSQGMNWCSQHKRLAIYLRDGLACCYCGDSIENGAKLTLDHLQPYSKGGSNDATNLVTACHKCNSLRGNRPVATFCAAVASYVEVDAKTLAKEVRAAARRPIDTKTAKTMVDRRGSCAKVLAAKVAGLEVW